MRRTTSVSAGVAHLVGPGTLKVVNGYLAFTPQGQQPLRLDPAALTAVTCYGDVSVTAAALEVLFRLNIPAAWLTPAGMRCRGRLARTDASTTLTRVRQHRAFARAEARLAWAKRVVGGKVAAMAAAGRHFQRHGSATAGPLMTRLTEYAERLSGVAAVESLLGLEGAASAAWFEFFASLLVSPWSFPGRVRRPPTDPTNALLSLGYTWLLTRATARAESRGYEIYLGGLHEYRPGRPSLACDLIEPLRVPAVDRWVVSVCNQGELRPDHFREGEDGGFRLQPRWFGRSLCAWETYWSEAGLDRELDRWLDELAGVIREWSPEAEGDSPGGL